MDEITRTAWTKTLARLENISQERRDHFAKLLTYLAECYDDDTNTNTYATVLLYRNDMLIIISAGATEEEAMGMVFKASEIMHDMVAAEAPAREMFN